MAWPNRAASALPATIAAASTTLQWAVSRRVVELRGRRGESHEPGGPERRSGPPGCRCGYTAQCLGAGSLTSSGAPIGKMKVAMVSAVVDPLFRAMWSAVPVSTNAWPAV